MLNYTTQQTIIQMFRMFFDILILWVLLYYTIKIVRNNSRTAQIFKGIILILIIRAIANFFGFKAVDWLAGVLVTYGFLAIIIIFQPEIRSLLEKLGKSIEPRTDCRVNHIFEKNGASHRADHQIKRGRPAAPQNGVSHTLVQH